MTKEELLAARVAVYKPGRTKNRARIATLREMLCPDEETRKAIEAVRAAAPEERARLKLETLPKYTPAGANSTINSPALTIQNGLLCLDIDNHHGEQQHTTEEIMAILRGLPFIAYAGRSASGNGIFALVPIYRKGEKCYAEYYESLAIGFGAFGISLDMSGRQIGRCRFVSYDPEAYFAENAQLYKTRRVIGAPAHTTRGRNTENPREETTKNPAPISAEERERAAALIACAVEASADITEKYENWVRLAYSLAATFGEEGREHFHTISEKHPKYKHTEADRLFSKCLKDGRGEIGPGTLYDICTEYGITLNGTRATAEADFSHLAR